MEKHSSAKLNAQIIDEAAAWFVEMGDAEVSAAARNEFNVWLRASPEHVRAYLQISALWDDVPMLGRAAVLTPQEMLDRARPDANVVPLGPAIRAERAGPRLTRMPKRRSRSPVVTLAASILLALLGCGLWIQWRHGMYTTGLGEVRTITLADGSTMELNALSSVRVQFRHRERDVYLLEGQAFFQVAKDVTRPFVVHSGTAQVRAVGTEFEVYRRQRETVVTVIEGRVALITALPGLGGTPQAPPPQDVPWPGSSRPPGVLQPDGAAMLLAAGEQVTLDSRVLTHLAHADLTAATAWMQQRLAFSSTPLTEVVEQYNRYHEKRLVILEPALSSFHVSGVFSTADSASLLAFLRSQPNLVVREKDTEIDISSR